MVQEKQVKSILNRHKKRDSWFLDDYSVNAYEGCSCNCLYCYIRGSKYGENMNDGLVVKTNALQILEKQLQVKAKKNQYGFVAVGSGTDAYMKLEEHYQLTQAFLKLFLKYRFPVFISTKCTMITRDIQILKQIDKTAVLPRNLAGKINRGAILSVSVSTLNQQISNMLEPAAAEPMQRLKVLQQLKQEGFLAGVNAIPLLPYISDTDEELEKIIAAAKQYGADYILTGSLTLFGKEAAHSKTLYYKFLERYDASLISKYDELYAGNFYPPKYYQEALKEKAERLCKKYKIRNSIIE